MAAKMGRDSVFYTAVTGAVFPIGLFNALVLTHYMSTAQYGQLGILFFISGLTSVVLNLFFLRGTERQVWGASDEGVDVDAAELVEAHQRPRVLGTGLMVSLVIGALAVGATVPLAPALSRLLVHTPRLGSAVIWTAASGALGSTWRLSANIGRWERRRGGFGTVWVLRPALALAIGWPLVAAGGGVAGAMAGTAIGTLLSLLVGLVISRRSYQVVLDRYAVGSIAKSSAHFAAMVIGLFVLHNGDVFLLSRFASSSQVGVYKLATNVTSLISYAVSAFLMAWAPLEFSTLFKAAYDQHGKERLKAEFTHYYLILGIFLVLVLSAVATPLVSLFSPSYHAARGYVAITGVGYLAYGLFLVIARSSSFSRRYFVYGVAAIASGAALVLTSIFLGPPLGGYGVAIGDTVGGLVGVAVIIAVAARWGELPAASPVRIGALLVIGGACWALGAPVAELAGGALDPVLKILSVVLFPLALLATGVIPARQRGALWAILRNSLRSRARPEALIGRVEELPRIDREIVIAIARDGEPPARVGSWTGLPETAVRLRLVAGLRRLSDAGAPCADDAAIAGYLLDTDSITARDAFARTLWDEGVEPVDLHQIESAFRTLHDAPARAWPANRRRRRRAGGRWALDPAQIAVLEHVIRDGRSPAELAHALGVSSSEVDRRVVGALRAVREDVGQGPADAVIGAYLFGGPARPATAQLWAAGVDPIELHRLELTIAHVRAVPRIRWRQMAERALQPPPEYEVEPDAPLLAPVAEPGPLPAPVIAGPGV